MSNIFVDWVALSLQTTEQVERVRQGVSELLHEKSEEDGLPFTDGKPGEYALSFLGITSGLPALLGARCKVPETFHGDAEDTHDFLEEWTKEHEEMLKETEVAWLAFIRSGNERDVYVLLWDGVQADSTRIFNSRWREEASLTLEAVVDLVARMDENGDFSAPIAPRLGVLRAEERALALEKAWPSGKPLQRSPRM